MYRIESKPYGFLLIFADFFTKDEVFKWVQESKTVLSKSNKDFGVLVDMRTLKPLAPDVKEAMEEGQKLYKQAGMRRSAVILETSIITMQFKNIAKESGIYQWERYISASSHPNWEQLAVDWIQKGIDPDQAYK